MMSPGEIADEHRYQRDGQTISAMRDIAEKLGYAVAAHGRRSAKDLDIIAVPWRDPAASAKELVAAFTARYEDKPTFLSRAERVSEAASGEIKSNKPHGRVAVILLREDDHRLIDLSIMPRIVPDITFVIAGDKPCAQCAMATVGCILPTVDGYPTMTHCFVPKKTTGKAEARHKLCARCTIKTACAKPVDTVPTDSIKACFFNNPAISGSVTKGADMAATDLKALGLPKLSDDTVKALMGYRITDCCSLCTHCTKHPDSGRGGEMGETYQCVANAIHPFKLPYGETGQYICSHFTARDAVRGKPA